MSLLNNLGLKLLAVAVAFMLWSVSHTTTLVERGFDLPVAVEGVPEELVVTGQSTDTVNVRVRGSRAAMRRLLEGDLLYDVDLAGARLGVTAHEVETQDLRLPRGLQVVSRSPAGIDFTLARRGRRSVALKADIVGTPAEGFKLDGIEIEPARIWISGPRSEVLRLGEVMTETIEVNGLDAPFETQVRPSVVGRNLWLENDRDVTVRVTISPAEVPETGEETG